MYHRLLKCSYLKLRLLDQVRGDSGETDRRRPRRLLESTSSGSLFYDRSARIAKLEVGVWPHNPPQIDLS